MQKQQGISLLELVLGIAIIATILIASTRFFNIAGENTKVKSAIDMLNQIADASYKWSEYNANFKQLKFSTLAEAGLLPKKYEDYEQVCKGCNPWGGDIRIEPAEDNSKLRIIFTGLPEHEGDSKNKACTKLQNQLHEYSPSCGKNSFTIEF